MTKIPKGSVLTEVEPYLVVPVYKDARTSRRSRSDDTTDPTVVPNLEELPKWEGCPIWDQCRSIDLLETPEIMKFLKRARRKISSSSSDGTTGSWRMLCILVTLRVVAKNLHDQKENNTGSPEGNEQQKMVNSNPTEHDRNRGQALPWWSVLVSDHYDDVREREIYPGDDEDEDEDENHALLVELWPLIQDYIPWKACERLYLRIQNRLHILTIPHPLTAWAQKTIFELTTEELEASWSVHQNIDAQTKRISKDIIPLQSNRLHTSKLWLDRVANIPERFVGVLIEDPLKITNGDEANDPSIEKNSTRDQISSVLQLPRPYQSCLPNTCLEINASYTMEEQIIQLGTSQGHENQNICCRWIALYDLTKAESETEGMYLSSMPKAKNCNCFRCAHEKKSMVCSLENDKPIEINSENLYQAQRLAHSYFQQEAFEKAMALYEKCYCYCKKSVANHTETEPKDEFSQWLANTEADLWHIMGAVLLSQQKFARAQQHWKNGSHYKRAHEELSNQLSKQEAYHYFLPERKCPVSKLSYRRIDRSESHSSRQSAISAATQSVFVASDAIDPSTCRKLIRWALDHASNNGGWTTSRHYSVPTTDLPIHQVPRLLEWFQSWMQEVLFPLLRDQYGSTSGSDDRRRFYVHDAFLVRYEATGSNCFLPLHLDESSHSCVVALNDDFDGGGSYMYSLGQSVVPPTGGLVSFLGNRCLHGGTPVTRGVRYILAFFLYLDEDLCHGRFPKANLNGIQTNKTSREEVVRSRNETYNKRFKKEEGSKSCPAEGGFSFSFITD